MSLNTSKKFDASVSSTILASYDNVALMRDSGLPSWLTQTLEEPIAIIAVCGGLMTAENSVIPNIPRLEILK